MKREAQIKRPSLQKKQPSRIKEEEKTQITVS